MSLQFKGSDAYTFFRSMVQPADDATQQHKTQATSEEFQDQPHARRALFQKASPFPRVAPEAPQTG